MMVIHVNDRYCEVPCPVCMSTARKHLFTDKNRREGLDIVGTCSRCLDCGMIYLSERPVWSEIIRFYDSMHNESNLTRTEIKSITNRKRKNAGVVIKDKLRDLVRKYRFRPHSWPLEPIPKSSMSMLDIGCGNGEKLIEFAERGWKIWGLDVSAIALQVAEQLLPDGKFILGELTEVDLPTEYFDAIRMDNCLEHIPNPLEVVQRCFEILKTGGRLFIYVPHGESLSLRLMKNYSVSSWMPFHLNLFTRPALGRILRYVGFTEFETYEYYPPTWLPLSLRQLVSKRGFWHKGTPGQKFLTYVLLPIGWLACKLGMGEELVAVAWK